MLDKGENSLMGLRDFFVKNVPVEVLTHDVSASLAPVTTLDSITGFFRNGRTATREEFMSIPACARGRNIICSSIASIGLDVRDRVTGMTVDVPRVIRTPDPRIPGVATYVWTLEDILLTGYGYWQITELFADTQRVRSVQRIAPDRITINTNSDSTEIESYSIDGHTPLPLSGIGSLVVFYGNDEGILNRAGTTIRTGAELERAAAMYAREPVPAMVLKSNGTSLPADRITKLLDSWSSARRNRSTAFLNADVTMEAVGFDPEKLQLAAARSYIATELARALGIPAYFIDAETGSSMTYSNASTTRQTLIDFSLIPLMNSITERLSMPDFVPSTLRVEYALDDYLRGSALERAQIYEILNRVGALSAEEIRVAEEMIR